jgi:hypothetical protein
MHDRLKKVRLTLSLIHFNSSVNLTGSHIKWMSFALHVPYSEFCKDGLIMAKWPKHVVIEIKYNNILLCLAETTKCFVAFYIVIRLCVYIYKQYSIHHRPQPTVCITRMKSNSPSFINQISCQTLRHIIFPHFLEFSFTFSCCFVYRIQFY